MQTSDYKPRWRVTINTHAGRMSPDGEHDSHDEAARVLADVAARQRGSAFPAMGAYIEVRNSDGRWEREDGSARA